MFATDEIFSTKNDLSYEYALLLESEKKKKQAQQPVEREIVITEGTVTKFAVFCLVGAALVAALVCNSGSVKSGTRNDKPHTVGKSLQP